MTLRLRRRYLVGIVCFAIAGLVGAAAIADHRWKQHRMYRAEVSEWFCRHRGTQCDGPSSAGIERRWNKRQVGYEVVVVALGAASAAFVLSGTLQRRDRT